jgi:stage II sporulation protein GA (sporulation sigma-E factor processing peptidase)
MILLTEQIILKEQIIHKRLIVSSSIGSIYSVIIAITKPNYWIINITKIIISIIMIIIGCNNVKRKNLINRIIIFYLIAFVFGGCSNAILYSINQNKDLNRKINSIFEPFGITILAGIFSIILIIYTFKIIYKKRKFKDILCKLKIINEGKEKNLRAMIDTGNSLIDPISKTPVVIIEKEKMLGIIPNEIIENNEDIICGKYDIKNEKYKSKIRLLPFSTIDNKNGMILGIRVEEVETEINDEKISKKNVVIGICNEKISKQYSCLIGGDYIEELY